MFGHIVPLYLDNICVYMYILCILKPVSLHKPLQSHCVCMCLCALYVNFPILLQKLRTKGHSDCASPDPDDCFGHSPLMDDRLGKLNEESDLIYKRSGVSTAFLFCSFLLIPVSMLIFTTGLKQERTQRLR